MTPRPLIAPALAAALALGGCTLFGDDDPEEPTGAAALLASLNENRRLEDELGDIERRIVLDCMEEQGHTLHDPYELQIWDTAEQQSLVERYPFSGFLLDREIALEWGFGRWASTDQAMTTGVYQEYMERFWPEFADADAAYAEFNELEPEALLDWYIAFMGQDWAVHRTGYEFAVEFLDIEEPQVDPDANLELTGNPDASVAPAPGGCVLEMIETLYDQPRPVPVTGQSDAYVWTWGPENPEDSADQAALLAEYRSAVAEAEDAMVDCLAEDGREGWVFDDTGALPVGRHLSAVYYPEMEWVGVDGEELDAPAFPAPPTDVPTDLEGRKAFEVELALAFVDCGETSGYREVATAAYDRVQLDFYTSIETELFTYQDDLREALAQAQDVVGG
ncbi:hypothetical protein AB0B28_13115 [Glycomyces sp. NPDC046736]|uniref:hypothetical protein n=1 Tax=Glycomyces sp. NPDC046736 TaxID=3155615 RepID=UPI0033CE6055